MLKIQYPKEQMHRIRYTKLSEQQIAAKLEAARAGPTCASPYSDALAGQALKIVCDDGLVLEYDFDRHNRLSLARSGPVSQSGAAGSGSAGSVPAGSGAAGSGAARTRAAYGALTLGRIVLFSHLVPGTQDGYQVIIDRGNHLATVFEVWFSGYSDNREVQREIHYGYVETAGDAAPQARHALTNRLEGKGFHWTQDTGIETLEIYPSVLYSTFVELTRLGGELCFCGPSDYVRLDDDLYVYSRVEAEFSGTLTLYVLALNEGRQIGVRLGFNAADALEYYMFTGNGESVGQLAFFEPFDDDGEKIVMGGGNRSAATRRGERLVYRPLLTNPAMTHEQVEAAVARKTVLFGPPTGMAGSQLPESAFLVGKHFTLRYDDDGPALQYRVDEPTQLRWRREGESAWHSETYRAWEPAPGVIFFAHLLSGTPRHDCVAVAVDFDNGLSTCVHGMLGTPYMANEASRKTWFGIIDVEGLTPPQYLRHRFTDELVGRTLTWHYSPGLTSMHVYTTPYSYSWIIFLPNDAGGLEWSGPAQYVKLRDDLYLFNWLEEACNGTLGVLVINTRMMHDCGIDYHCGQDGLRIGAVGAKARNAGQLDLKRFYGPKQV